MNRRRFLTQAGCAAVVLGASRSLLANDVVGRPALGLGFSLYGMKSLATVDAIRVCRDIGYDCFELPVMTDWPADSATVSAADRQKIRVAMGESKLRLSALMENLPLIVDEQQHARHLDRIKRAAELGHELAPQGPPLIETVLGGQPAQWSDVKQAMVERLGSWADVAARHETTIAIKPHVGGALHRPADAVWLVEQVGSPWIRCVYDFSHYVLRGIDMADSIEQLARFTRFVHVKDARGDATKFQFLLPGDGQTDYVRQLRLLADAGYRGDVVIEVSGQIHSQPGYDPVATAKRCFAAMNK